jgi:pimeloyl-ACP methyl ester carboxylesterase
MALETTHIQASRLDDGTTFDVYVPPLADQCAPAGLLVSVLPRHAAVPKYQALELFSDFADTHRRLVLAPHFEFDSGFQRLGIGGPVRYDLRLLRIVDEVARRYGLATKRFDLFGYSAGGQFAHRFLYVHPERLRAVAVGAPGTVTLPTTDDVWPTGVANLAELTGRGYALAEVRRPRIMLYVGERDVTPEALAQTEEANRLGRTRVDRARTLHEAWLAAAIPHAYVEVPGMGHMDVHMSLERVHHFLAST